MFSVSAVNTSPTNTSLMIDYVSCYEINETISRLVTIMSSGLVEPSIRRVEALKFGLSGFCFHYISLAFSLC